MFRALGFKTFRDFRVWAESLEGLKFGILHYMAAAAALCDIRVRGVVCPGAFVKARDHQNVK